MNKIIQLFREALDDSEKDFTSGSIKRAIVILAIPMILEMLMESLFAVIDVFYVSRVGIDAVATVGITESIVTLIYALGIGMSMGATAMVARRVGEKRPEAAARAAGQVILLGCGVSAIIAFVGIVFAADILRLMKAGPELVEKGTRYVQIMLGGNLSILFLFLLNGVFRGAGNAGIAMRTLWIANGINIILDPLLIFGIGPFPELGLTGAAIATTTGRSIGVLYQIRMLSGRRGVIQLSWKDLGIDWHIIRRLVRVSLSGTGQYLIASASWIFLTRIIADFGSEALAGYTIGIRLLIFTILPSWGMANAAATLVGQNLGAGQPERAERSVWQTSFYNMLFLLSVSLLFGWQAPWFISLFNGEAAVVEAGVLTLRIICFGYIFFAYGMVASQAFNGAGDTLTPMLINLFCFWLLEIPLGYLLARELGLGVAGVASAIAISETMLALIAIMIFRRGKWKEAVI